MDFAFIARRLDAYERLIRLDKPIGALLLLWPTLWALWLDAHGRPRVETVVIFVLGTLLMRSAGCAINDFREIPPRSNAFAGAPGIGPGEGLTTWSVPTLERVPRATDPSCMASGTCGPIGYCTAGQIWDPCLVDADCDQPSDTCRLVVNFADVADLTFGLLKTTRGSTATSITPVTPGCSRKIDFTLNAARATNRIKMRLSGTVGSRFVKDVDRFRVGNY